jgi:hypothetical protein
MNPKGTTIAKAYPIYVEYLLLNNGLKEELKPLP